MRNHICGRINLLVDYSWWPKFDKVGRSEFHLVLLEYYGWDEGDIIDSLLEIFWKLTMTFPFGCSMMLSIWVFACDCGVWASSICQSSGRFTWSHADVTLRAVKFEEHQFSTDLPTSLTSKSRHFTCTRHSGCGEIHLVRGVTIFSPPLY